MSRNSWIFVALGVFFWIADAVFIRYTGVELFHFGSNWLIGLFLATPFAGWVLIKTCLAITDTPEGQASLTHHHFMHDGLASERRCNFSISLALR